MGRLPLLPFSGTPAGRSAEPRPCRSCSRCSSAPGTAPRNRGSPTHRCIHAQAPEDAFPGCRPRTARALEVPHAPLCAYPRALSGVAAGSLDLATLK